VEVNLVRVIENMGIIIGKLAAVEPVAIVPVIPVLVLLLGGPDCHLLGNC
jgi:hypothetical protein